MNSIITQLTAEATSKNTTKNSCKFNKVDDLQLLFK